MKAIAIYEHGGPEVLRYVDLPEPEISEEEVLVRLRASALNHMDIFVRRGWRGLKLSFPHIPGADGAGVVEEVGASVEGVERGDPVVLNPGLNCGRCEFCLRGDDSLCVRYGILGEHANGTYAELVRVPGRNVLPMKKGFSFGEAAAIPLVFMTAWRMLVTRAKVQPGEDVLVLGAGGGVASAAIQIAALLGARVLATSSSEEKLKKAQEIGADIVINYREQPFEKVVWERTGKRGVDVVVETVGEATWKKSLRSLAKGGRLVTCGATTGPMGETDIRLVFWRQLRIIGSTMGTRAGLEEVLDLAWSHRLSPSIHAVLPLEKARDAQMIMESGEHFGKIVLQP
ncbi:MAG: zinc-binding dehydrogenase [Candidatus Thermoplasmatota archaeon]|nr:zinc-binding dehydrogenase [Candidatus Thermoplasmatota archaeon]